ncbi:MAG: Rieske 2Fe-2S domain-containing protein [Anaerolineales bacterium]|nr:Rieske 2Fe-2S domain-containing protein [Anaerolineales bacterium]
MPTTKSSGLNGHLCASKDISEGGHGVRFNVIKDGTVAPAFVIRHGQISKAYINRCSHLMLELDWEPGEVFDLDGEYLICANHGALYEPATGNCVGGPCNGVGLEPLTVVEITGNVYLEDPQYNLP